MTIALGRNQRTQLRLAAQDTAPFRWLKRNRDRLLLRRWNNHGRPVPPPHAFKRALVLAAGEQTGAGLFVETGTFYGDMVDAVSEQFRRIVSIELDPRLHQIARRRFRDRDHIQLLLGSSEDLLPGVLQRITEPAVFWLDAHYSGSRTAVGSSETPIVSELNSVLNHRIKKHVILVDDARCFDGTHDYPRLNDIQDLLVEHSGEYSWQVASDVIQIRPKP
jgi:hypothetical protein